MVIPALSVSKVKFESTVAVLGIQLKGVGVDPSAYLTAVPKPPPPPPAILTSIVSPTVLKVLPAPMKLSVFPEPTKDPLD